MFFMHILPWTQIFLIGILSIEGMELQGEKSTKWLNYTGNLFRKNQILIGVC